MSKQTFESPAEPKTSLDYAFIQAQSAEDTGSIQDFYNIFVNQVFYLLLEDIEGNQELDSQVINPRLISVEGHETALIFDTEERMAEFIDTPSDFVTLTGEALVNMVVNKDIQIGLNLGVAPSSLIIDATILKSIWTDIQKTVEVIESSNLENLSVSPPFLASEILIKSLHIHLELWRDTLKEALLVQAILRGNTKPSFIVCLVFKDADNVLNETELQLIQKISSATLPYISSDDIEGLQVCVLQKPKRLGDKNGLLQTARKHGLNFYAAELPFAQTQSEYLH